jgi:peptide/nickel transport system permease protein
MTAEVDSTATYEPAGWTSSRTVERVLTISACVLLVVFVFFAAFPGAVTQADPLETSLPDRLEPPVFAGGTWEHPLGTDSVGRDILARIAHGARVTLLVALAVLLVGGFVGTALGLTAGSLGGATDTLIMRTADLAISYPTILIAVLLSVAVGPAISNVVIVVSLVIWGRFARIIRGEVLSIRERGYVAAAVVAGGSSRHIVTTHVLPNVAGILIITISLQVGWVILLESSLSFLGAGVPPPIPAWGSMVAEGREFVTRAWWVPGIPAFAVALVVVALNILGDALQVRLGHGAE